MPENTAIDVAVLKEQMRRISTDMKIVNTEQSRKLDLVFSQLSEARGGWRTMVYFLTQYRTGINESQATALLTA